jgi:anti-sigma regulatory factor (Ser/Thr protein kinase)
LAADPLPKRCIVKEDTAVYAVRSMVRPFAAKLGFEPEVVEELIIVVSELASNILKYGSRGFIEVSELHLEVDGVRGIQIVAEDETAPFDLDGALRDGYDSHGKIDPAQVFGRRGIGAGLGAVARLSDEVRMESFEDGNKKRLIVRRVLGGKPRRGSKP